MEELNDLWVLEYSVTQRCVHIATVGEMLESNLSIVKNSIDNDFKPIAFARTADEANALADEFEVMLGKAVAA